MSLTTVPKSGSTVPQTTAPLARPQVTFGTPSATTARIEALKQRLNNPEAPINAAPPRPAGSTARAEQYAKLKNQAQISAPAPQQTYTQPMQDIEPPPSDLTAEAAPTDGVAPIAAEPTAQTDNSIGEKPAAEATSEPLSPQFVALAKQERAIRKARQELKVQQDAWKAQQASFVSMDVLKTDPLKALAEAGVSYDRLTELQLSQVAPDPNQHLLDKIAALEQKLASVDEQFTKRDTQAYEAAVNQIRNDVKLLVDSDPTFETIKATGESEAVVELIRKVFDKEGVILAVEEAANLIEDKLLERKLNEIQLLTKLSKVKSRMEKQAEALAEANPVQQHPGPKTLTNQGTVTRPLSARERAIMAFENAKLKV
jgi:hypothetical protein